MMPFKSDTELAAMAIPARAQYLNDRGAEAQDFAEYQDRYLEDESFEADPYDTDRAEDRYVSQFGW